MQDGEGEDESEGGVVGEEDGEEDKLPDQGDDGGQDPHEQQQLRNNWQLFVKWVFNLVMKYCSKWQKRKPASRE